MRKLKRYINKIIRIIFWEILASFMRLLPINNKKIYFESFLGRYYSDNPKVLYEYIDKNYDYKCVWGFKNVLKTYPDCVIVKRMSIKYLYHISTAKYIINNSRMPNDYTKRTNQIYVQTWHGTPLKKLVNDMENVTLPNTTSELYKANFSKDVSKWDFLISPNGYSTKHFKSAFKYKGKILEYGYPRNEELLNYDEKKIKDIRLKLDLLDELIIIYMPTFRDNKYVKKGHYIQDIKIDFNKIQAMFPNEKIKILIRNHYLVKVINYQYPKNNLVIDVTNYQNINELFLISNVLITDYSSVFFDYMLLKKPIIFYQYDQLSYMEELRGFYLDLKQLPGEIVVEEKDLYPAIKNALDKNYNIDKIYFKLLEKECFNLDKLDSSKKIVEDILKDYK